MRTARREKIYKDIQRYSKIWLYKDVRTRGLLKSLTTGCDTGGPSTEMQDVFKDDNISDVHQFQLNNLQPYTNYSCYVKAIANSSMSNRSEIVTVVTNEDGR